AVGVEPHRGTGASNLVKPPVAALLVDQGHALESQPCAHRGGIEEVLADHLAVVFHHRYPRVVAGLEFGVVVDVAHLDSEAVLGGHHGKVGDEVLAQVAAVAAVHHHCRHAGLNRNTSSSLPSNSASK